MTMPIKNKTVNIGILVPQSNFIPHLTRDIPDALQLGLTDYSEQYCVHLIHCGYNAEKQILENKLQNLIMEKRIDIILCPLNSHLIETLKPTCSINQVTLIINTMGEDPTPNNSMDGSTFINSFHHWHTCWLSGYVATQQASKKADTTNVATMHCIHDGGYGASLALAVGVESAEGEIVHTAITHREAREQDASADIQEVVANKPDTIIANYSSKEALSFLKTYRKTSQDTRLFALPYLVDEQILDELGDDALGVQSLSQWRKDGAAHRQFAGDFFAMTGHDVNPYVLMAYESGKLINAALQTLQTYSYTGINQALAQASFAGPRGEVSFNADDMQLQRPYHLREVSRNEDGSLYNRVIEDVTPPQLSYEHYRAAQNSGDKQGWLNPYLIA
ncbi:Uncharacterised protein [BD1-7 clade bacterium]|nr:Uncharacterised protein [BD1-7 clade bacterium]